MEGGGVPDWGVDAVLAFLVSERRGAKLAGRRRWDGKTDCLWC